MESKKKKEKTHHLSWEKNQIGIRLSTTACKMNSQQLS